MRPKEIIFHPEECGNKDCDDRLCPYPHLDTWEVDGVHFLTRDDAEHAASNFEGAVSMWGGTERLAFELFKTDWPHGADEKWKKHVELHDAAYRRYIVLAKAALLFVCGTEG